MLNDITKLLNECDSLLITAGAGMGVDSGLPDFRGNHGFWKEYPMFKDKLSFSKVATPQTFKNNPELAWGFYGHRYDTYKNIIPHLGFSLLLEIAKNKFNNNYFVITSNVDEQFQKAGFNPAYIEEIHGSIFNFQCIDACVYETWRSDYIFNIDNTKCISKIIPLCKFCNDTARPNILMFNDGDWVYNSTQHDNFKKWSNKFKSPLVIEIGAGKAISSIREISEDYKNTLIRINPTEADIPHNKGISLYMTGLEGIRLIHSLI